MSHTNYHLNRLILYQRVTAFTFCNEPAIGLPKEWKPVQELTDH